jgi:hypothetical protein
MISEAFEVFGYPVPVLSDFVPFPALVAILPDNQPK